MGHDSVIFDRNYLTCRGASLYQTEKGLYRRSFFPLQTIKYTILHDKKGASGREKLHG